MTIVFAVRYLVRTGLIARLRATCEPVLALSWDDPDLVAELRDLGIVAVELPRPEVDRRAEILFHEQAMAFARRLGSPSTRIDRARNTWSRPRSVRARRWLGWQRDRLLARRPGREEAVDRELEQLVPTATNLDENLEFLARHQVDAVFSVTPFAAQERVVLLAAERAGLPTCTSILSFDNITTRPPLPITFDRYLVWNRYNRDEILRGYRGVTEPRVRIVGPAQFDFYADPDNVDDADRWRSRLGLEAGAPTVLYGAGATTVAPHETQHVDDICRAVAAGVLPADLRVVLRRHPVDNSGRWERFADHPCVVFDDPGRIGSESLRPGHVNLDQRQVVDLCSSLAHTDVHVSVSSTMTIDGAFFDKPQIGPAYDAQPGRRFDRHARALYRREHFVPIVASKGMDLVTSPDQLVASIARHLADPGSAAAARAAMRRDLCTYTDGACTARVADEVERFVAEVVSEAAGPRGPASGDAQSSSSS